MPAYRPLLDRFIEKFELQREPDGQPPLKSPCWNWTACTGKRGYGKFQASPKKCMDAHKVSFEIFFGFVPPGTELHHTCHNRRCVNPNHLEPMSHMANCQWADRRSGQTTGRTYVLKPFQKQWTEEEIRQYWALRDARRLAKNAKLTGRPPKPLIERFARMLQLNWDTDCWEWLGKKVKGGYGRMCCRERTTVINQMAHRVSYEIFVGPIPPEMTIDHMCRNTGCVNPHHLRLLTRSQNSDGGWVKAMREKTHCAKNHPFNELNTIPRKLHGKVIGRYCRVCRTHGPARDELLIKLGLPLD